MHCGTLSPGWLNGKHPTKWEGVVERMVCFTKDNDCCHWYSLVSMKNCSGFIVYKFGHFPTAVDSCSLRYCGAGETGKWHINQSWTGHYLLAVEGEKVGWICLRSPLRLFNIVMVPLSLEVDWQAIFFSPPPPLYNMWGSTDAPLISPENHVFPSPNPPYLVLSGGKSKDFSFKRNNQRDKTAETRFPMAEYFH